MVRGDLVERYYWPMGDENYGPGLRRTITVNGTPHELMYYPNGNMITAYVLTASGQRQAAIVGSIWNGVNRDEKENPNGSGRYVWTDTNGDGLIEGGNTDGSVIGSGTDGEIEWTIPLGTPGGLDFFNPWVDDEGNLWFLENLNLIKVPLGDAQGNKFDSLGNPLYDWDNKVTVVTHSYSDPNGGFIPKTIRTAGNGDIYALGWTSVAVGTFTGINGADWVARYNSAGQLQAMFPSIDNIYASIAIDPSVADPQYFVTGETINTNLFTKDGLLVAQFTNNSGTPLGTGSGSPSGWMDQPYSVGVFSDPSTGEMYVYGENAYFGSSTRWRIDGLDTIHFPTEAGYSGDFSYSPTTAITGRWEFNDNLNDTVGGNTGTFSGGTASYSTGHTGNDNAIHLDGSDDYVQLPYATDPSSYTISAWVKADTSGVMNIVDRGDGSFGAISHQLRIVSDTRTGHSGQYVFEHYLYDGGLKTVTGTTDISAGQWYFVAITATNNGQMHLYVGDPSSSSFGEEGSAQNIGTLWTGGNQFDVGSGNITANFFDGLVDDLRIYDAAMGQTDLESIFDGTDNPTAVSVYASDATASEQSLDPGVFVIQRNVPAGDLEVTYSITTGGTNATEGSDYHLISGGTTLSGTVTIPSGSTSVLITVTPLDDSSVEGNETVILNLSDGGSATVTIVDDDTTSVPPNGRWPFEDEFLSPDSGHEFGLSDYVGSNNGVNHGTTYFDAPTSYPSYDGPATYVTGHTGRAVSFDGQNDDITIPYGTDASAYTIAAWVNPDLNRNTGSANAMNIIARTDSGLPNINGNGIVSEQIRINSSGKFEHYTYDGTGHTVTGTTTVTAGNWYFVAITAASNGEMHLYVNGSEEGTATSIGNLWTGGDRFNVGGVMGGMGYLKGLVDELQVFDSPLSATQISALYGQSTLVSVSTTDADAYEAGTDTGTFTITRTGSTASDLVVFYNIDSGTAGSADNGTDYSTLNGTVTIPSGSSTATIVVTPIDDSQFELDENVVLTIASNSNYSVGASQ